MNLQKYFQYHDNVGLNIIFLPCIYFFLLAEFIQSSFFGVNKKPFFPYGKFVGVRGKKVGLGHYANEI